MRGRWVGFNSVLCEAQVQGIIVTGPIRISHVSLTGVRGSCAPCGVELEPNPGWDGVVDPAGPMCCCCCRDLLEPGPWPRWFGWEPGGGASWGALGVCGCGVWDPANLGGVWWGVGDRLWAGDGELPRMAAKWGMELVCWFALAEVTDEEGAPVVPAPTLWGPIGPTAETLPGPPTDPGCARGLATGREGGVPICVFGLKRVNKSGKKGKRN